MRLIFFASPPCAEGLIEKLTTARNFENGTFNCLIAIGQFENNSEIVILGCMPPGCEYDIFISYRQKDNKYHGCGNVTSRILPICIHQLDSADKQMLEGELGGVLQGIEFVYRTAGVVRPLKAVEEEAKANLNHTYYRDQINKVDRH